MRLSAYQSILSTIRLCTIAAITTLCFHPVVAQERSSDHSEIDSEDLEAEVITIAQGRALIARDASLEYGYEALGVKDWAEAKRYLLNALAEERKAFGDSFEGTEEVLFSLNVANTKLGETDDELTKQFEAKSHRLLESFDLSGFSELERDRLENELLEHSKRSTRQGLALVVAVSDLAALSGQEGTPAFADAAESLYTQFRSFESTLKETEAKEEATLREFAEAAKGNVEYEEVSQRLLSEFRLKKDDLREEAIGGLASAALTAYADSLPPAKSDLASKLYREAFERLKRFQEEWHQNEEPWYGGRVIANRFVNSLDQQMYDARLAGEWLEVKNLVEEAIPIVEALDGPLDPWTLLHDEAKRLLQATRPEQLKYAESIRSELQEFDRIRNSPQAAEAIPIGMDIVRVRTEILGEDCVQAAWINRVLGYLLWTQQRYDDAFDRLQWSALSYSAFVSSSNNRMQSAIRDMLVNATAATEAGLATPQLLNSLRETVGTLTNRLGKEHAMVAASQVTFQLLETMIKLTPQQKDRHEMLQAKKVKRNEFFNRGQFPSALSLADEVVAQTTELLGEYSMETLMARQVRANCIRMTGDSSGAIGSYRSIMQDFNHLPYNRVEGFANVCSEFATLLAFVGGVENQGEALRWVGQSKKLIATTLGKKSYNYVWALMSEGEILRDGLGDAQAALLVFQEANQLSNDLGGEETFAYAQGLVNVASCQRLLGLYEASDQHLRDALEIRKSQGLDSPRWLAWNLWALGETNFHWGKFEEAAQFYGKCLDLKEEFTPSETDIGHVYGNYLAAASWTEDPDPQVEKILQRFMKIRGEHFKQNKAAFAAECVNAASKVMIEPGGTFFGRVNDLRADVVLQLAGMAVDILEPSSSNPIVLGNALQLMGDAAEYLGDHRAAISHYQRLLALLDEMENPPAWLQGNAHVGLSISYEKSFVFDQCLLQRREAIDVFTRGFGAESEKVANPTLGLARVLMILGDLDDSERLIQEVCNYCSKRQLADAMRQLAIISRLRGNLQRSERWLHSARRVTTELKGNQQLLALIDLSLAELYLLQGEFELAKTLAKKTIQEDHLDQNTIAEEILAIASLQTGDLEVAQELLTKGLAIPSPSARARFGMASLRQARDDQEAAKEQLLAELRFAVETQTKFGNALSQRQKLKMRQRVDGAVDQFVSYAVQAQIPDEEIYRWLMPMKGLVFDEEYSRREWLRENVNSKNQELITELAKVSQQLSRELFKESSGPARVDSVERIQELTLQRERIEKSLGVELAKSLAGSQNIFDDGLARLQSRLGNDDCLVDFIFYQHHDRIGVPNAIPTKKALSFVVTPDSVTLVDLGEAAPVRSAVADWRKHLIERNAGEFAEANQTVRKVLWTPIEPHAAGKLNLYLSVENALAEISFAALPDADDGYLIDHHRITLVSAPRVLLHDAEQPASAQPASQSELLLVGGLDYSHPAENLLDSNLADSPVDEALGEPNQESQLDIPMTSMVALRSASPVTAWQALPGTEAEIRKLRTLAESAGQPMSVTELSGRAASEAVLKTKMPQARWAHIATHGFFAKQPGGAQNGTDSPWAFQSLSQESVVGFDPKLLSGIVVSGGNVKNDEAQDGILTAAEIEMLDLSRTELIVLSACETGLGDLQSGEGVMGLQRSLHLAGCDDVVASLWKVDDAATAILMKSFYQQLWSGKSPADALREAQLALRNGELAGSERLRGVTRVQEPGKATASPSAVDPLFWAAFTLSSKSTK